MLPTAPKPPPKTKPKNMPLIIACHESLPYIDRPLSPGTLIAAQALVSAELPSSSVFNTPHPSLPPPPPTTTTTTSSAAVAPAAPAPTPLKAIDLSRYEEVDTSSPPSVLKTASAHLTSRLQALALLEKHGRNAWLVGNAELEEVLRGYEEELVQVREEAEEVNRQRKRAQEGARAELELGESAWRDGVEGLVKVGVGGLELERRS